MRVVVRAIFILLLFFRLARASQRACNDKCAVAPLSCVSELHGTIQTMKSNKFQIRNEFVSSNLGSRTDLLSLRGGGLSNLSGLLTSKKATSWILLVGAVVIDTLSATLMKISREESSISKLAASYVGYFTSLSLFAMSLEVLDVSVAYAVWGALGTGIISVFGVLFLNESLDASKLLYLGMISLGVVGLSLQESDHG